MGVCGVGWFNIFFFPNSRGFFRAAAVLCGNGLFDRVRRSGRIVAIEADQNFIRGVLQPGVRLVQLAGRLGGQLAKLVPVLHMGKRPKNQI